MSFILPPGTLNNVLDVLPPPSVSTTPGGNTSIQLHLGGKWVIRLMRANGGGTSAVEVFNCAQNVTGSAAASALAANAFEQRARIRSTTATLATSQNRWAFNETCLWRGNSAGLGGYYTAFCWGPVSGPSDSKFFAGFASAVPTIAGAAVETSTAITDAAGFGLDSTDTNLQFMHNDSTGSATKVALGASFPGRTALADFYLGAIWEGANEGTIHYRLVNLISGADTGELTATTNLPSTSTFYLPCIVEGEKSAGTAIVTDHQLIYCETAY